ncbi:hypothetical protein D3C78_1058480 [compost metagenome]
MGFLLDVVYQYAIEHAAQFAAQLGQLAFGLGMGACHQALGQRCHGCRRRIAQALAQHGPGQGPVFLKLGFQPGKQGAVRRVAA